MGLDFSYDLYFNRDSLWEVLTGVADIADQVEHPTTFLFTQSEHEIVLPFEAWMDTRPVLDHQDEQPEWHFMTALHFDMDDALRYYLQRIGVDNSASSRASIGYIYLSVYKGKQVPRAGYPCEDLIMLQFAAATTKMSILFAESTSIRQAFVRLLKNHQGIYGLLDMEDDLEVIWWKGEEQEERIPLSWMPLSDIDYYLRTGELPYRLN